MPGAGCGAAEEPLRGYVAAHPARDLIDGLQIGPIATVLHRIRDVEHETCGLSSRSRTKRLTTNR